MLNKAFMRLGLVSAGLTQPECAYKKEINEELEKLKTQMMAMIDPRSESEKRDERQQHKLAVKYSKKKRR